MTAKKKVISSRTIRDYARICASHNRLEKLRYKVRADLLALLDDGFIPSVSGPFVLVKSFQARVDTDKWSWKMLATELAIKYFTALGDPDAVGKAMGLILDAELNAPRKNITVLSAKPNPTLLGELLRQ